jgi:anti-anti-sigma factor
MKLTTTVYPDRLQITAEGRLDATWAEHFLETTRRAVREGHHQLRLDASALEYLSSAGLRSLLQTHREVGSVLGSFRIVRASDFVVKTLRMSGFDSLLALDEGLAAAAEAKVGKPLAPPLAQGGWSVAGAEVEVYALDAAPPMRGAQLGGWTAWTPIPATACREVELGAEQVALGLGTPGQSEDIRERLGDFLSVAGCTVFLPGDGSEAPDYLVGTGQFVPRLQIADALRATGRFSQLLRFHPSQAGAPLTLDQLLEGALASTRATQVVAVVLAEIDGLVGLSWARSPGLLAADSRAAEFPAVREWLSFSGERVHRGDLALVVAFASTEPPPQGIAVPPLPSHPGWRVHAHAAVFPFRPLPNGKLELAATVQQLFSGAAPQALLHLVEDDRPALGLGHSAFIRGACWCAPVQFSPEDLS